MLLAGDQTTTSMVEETGLHRQTVNTLMRCLRKHKVVFISDWEPDNLGRDAFPVFRIGNKKDAVRYKQTGKERTQRYRAAKKNAAKFPTSTLTNTLTAHLHV